MNLIGTNHFLYFRSSKLPVKQWICLINEDETSEDNESLASLSKTWKEINDTDDINMSTKEKFSFECSSCKELFRLKSGLIRHSFLSHGVGYKCKCCSRIFANCSTITNHLTTKHSRQGYPCYNCDFKTGKASEFKKHLTEQACMKESTDQVLIKNGIENNKDDKAVGKNLKIKTADQKKNHPCDLCDSSFTLKNQLLVHKNQEHGADIKCDICNQVFNSMVSLRSHKFTKHTGKDKICEICGYSTKKTYDFKRHQVKHSSVYTIKCSVCNKGFYSQYEFNEHKNVHTAERPYQCEVCGVDYSRRSSLILHRNRKHPEIYDTSKRCQICNQVCLTKETMAAHIKTHVEGRKRYYCDICGKGLLTRVILKIHRRSHTGEKPFDCSYCGRAFSCKKNLSVHIRLHTGDRPYSCAFCWKSYTKSSALKAHEKSHSNHHQILPL